MPPRKAKGKAPAEPAKTRSSRRKGKAAAEEEVEEVPEVHEAQESQEKPEILEPANDPEPPQPAVANAEPERDGQEAAEPEEPAKEKSAEVEMEVEMEVEAKETAEQPAAQPSAPSMTMDERAAKLEALRAKMRETAIANRKDLIEEHQKQKTSVRDLARLEKQRKLAETLRLKADAEETGEDLERKKNWEWTIEDNDAWEKKLQKKAKRADFEFHDDATAAQRKYKKDVDKLKPDLGTYNQHKEAALGLAPGTLLHTPDVTGQLVASGSVSAAQRTAAENLYRDGNSLLYADNKPSEEAIDRVVAKLNLDIDGRRKFSRKRANEDEGDITYINERNKVFNKKISRYYDKYTAEIRASFERGTAL